MKISAQGRMAVIRAAINSEILIKLRQIPGRKKWVGNVLLFEPTAQAIEYVQDKFPTAEWTDEAKDFVNVINLVKANAIPAPAIEMRDFVYKTKPYDHQDRIFKLSRDLPAYAYFMEQGTGKTKVVLDNAAWLWAKGKIRGMLVIAYPSEVHENWLINEAPIHMPDWCPWEGVAWNGRKGEKAVEKLYKVNLEDSKLLILTMNVEALSTKRGFEVARRFLSTYASMCVVDESTSIKTPGAKRTKNMIKLGMLAPVRRILTGTPITKGPLDAFSQFMFLDESILGFGSFYAFRNRYAVMKPLPGVRSRAGRQIDVVVGYQNTEELQSKIAPFSARVLKKDCLDLPEKVYQRLYVTLTDEQRRLYNEFVENIMAEFNGRIIAAPLAITRMLRLHQIVCGFMPVENPDENFGDPIDGGNPRLDALMEQLELVEGKVIIWATYRYSIREVVAALSAKYGADKVCGYSGMTPKHLRMGLIQRFQNPDDPLRFFVANRAAAYGLTLTEAQTVIFYNNGFDLEVRLQEEDRAHRIGQRNNVTYIDIECKGTIDSKIIAALRSKRDVASSITGDEVVQWLSI